MKHLNKHKDITSYASKLSDYIKLNNVTSLIDNQSIKFDNTSNETIVVVKTTTPNEEVIFQFWDNTSSSIISWGDGSTDILGPHAFNKETGHVDDYARHTYAVPGEYKVILKGNNVTTHWNYINDDVYYTELDGEDIDWDHGINKSFPIQTRKAIQLGKHTKTCIGLFLRKENLIEISENLFKYCSHAEYFNNCFYFTKIKTIPDNLFSKCINAISFLGCFGNCSLLTEIPSKLFTNCTNALIFEACFYECISLLKIGNNLFSNNIQINNFISCFCNCPNIKHEYNLTPSGEPKLWEREGKPGYPKRIFGDGFASGSSDVFWTTIHPSWDGNAILKSVNLKVFDVNEYTKDLYMNNTLAIHENDIYNVDVYECDDIIVKYYDEYNKLTTKIFSPIDHKFNNIALCISGEDPLISEYMFNTEETNEVFLGTSNSEIEINWGDNNIEIFDKNSVLRHTYIENGDYAIKVKNLNITNYSINYNLYKNDNSNIVIERTNIYKINKLEVPFSGKYCKFNDIISLIEINENIFKYFNKIEDFKKCFYFCKNLSNIPDMLFYNCKQAIDFSECFCACESINEIPGDLFKNCLYAKYFDYCFQEMNFHHIPSNLFKENIYATNFYACFFGNYNLKTIGDNLFAYNKNATNFSMCFVESPYINHAYNFTPEGEPKLWERAGLPGYPNSINGEAFIDSDSIDIFKNSIPMSWGGTL